MPKNYLEPPKLETTLFTHELVRDYGEDRLHRAEL